ncbi:MAG: HAD family hydrolase [Methylothermaceae bacteria B42]|nr:MAG: HAD family hydrolase [Methylothermaceae bacteria B42]HHJ38304.1 TIGR01458 family HAD-type hydrolase [Methylothermaceae bacterium]
MKKIEGIRGLLLDLDGVLYVGDTVIEGAHNAISAIRQHGYKLRFITNTSTRSLASLQKKLAGLGFDIPKSEIISAPQAALLYLKSKGRPVCHLLLAEDVKQDFTRFQQSDEKADAVVIGDIGEAWNYAILNRAFRLLFSGAELIAMHKNRFWQTESGLQMDIGGFVVALEYASGKQAKIMGKPSIDFFQMALQDMGLPASQVAIVGDDIESDIGGGQQAGLMGILVKTGKYRESFVKASKIQPDLVIDSIADLPKVLGLSE